MAGVTRKVLRLLVVLFAVSAFTFLLTSLLPGDPALSILGPSATPESVARVRHDLRLDKPLVVQYGHWVNGVFHGDLGRAYNNNEKVVDILKERLPVTLELLVLAQVLALAVAIPVGLYAAYRENRLSDKVITGVSFSLLSIPDFVVAIVLVYFFAVRLKVLPASGFVHFSDSLTQNLRSMALPTIALALAPAAVYSRLLRTDMIATLQEDFILTARAKGMPTWRILLGHALRPSSFSLLTVAGINTGALIGGAVIVEYLFALPGMGFRVVDAISRREYLVVQGLVLVIAAGYVIANFLVDLLYSVVDPRIRNA